MLINYKLIVNVGWLWWYDDNDRNSIHFLLIKLLSQ
jgi:hypothetical protein